MLRKGHCSRDASMQKSTRMAAWNHRKFMKIASGDGPKGIQEAPLSLTCNMMCTTRGQGSPAVHLFCDLGATQALIGPKLGAQGTPKSK